MSNLLQLLLIIYSTALLANCIISVYLWKTHHEKLYEVSSIIWISSLLNFSLQSVFQDSDIKMLFSFSTYVITSWYFYKLTQISMDHVKKDRALLVLSGLLIALGHLFLVTGSTYQIASAFCAIGISLPMLKASYEIFKQPKIPLKTGKVLGVILIINAVHVLNYPIFRLTENGAMIGFSITLALLFAFSILLYTLIVEKISASYTARLKAEVISKTREIRSVSEDYRNLLTIVCHDLVNPLTILKFHSEKLVKFDQMDSQNRQLSVSKINTSVATITSILSKVRELQKIKVGKKTLHLEKVDLYQCLLATTELYSSFFAQKEIKIMIEKSENLKAEVHGDYILMMHQVLGNIITNAIKFSEPKSEVVFHFYLKDDMVGLTIKDNGLGMPVSVSQNIFSFDKQTSRLGTQNEVGSGFGMPLVKTCVDLMGGNISIQSIEKTYAGQMDHGSTVTLEFRRSA